MLAAFSLLTGPLAKYAAIAVVVVAFIAGGAWVVHEHDNRVRAQVALSQERAINAQKDADHARIISALQADKVASDVRANKANAIRKAINNAPRGVACDNPAIDAVLLGLHNDDTGAIPKGANTAKPVNLHTAATNSRH